MQIYVVGCFDRLVRLSCCDSLPTTSSTLHRVEVVYEEEDALLWLQLCMRYIVIHFDTGRCWRCLGQ